MTKESSRFRGWKSVLKMGPILASLLKNKKALKIRPVFGTDFRSRKWDHSLSIFFNFFDVFSQPFRVSWSCPSFVWGQAGLDWAGVRVCWVMQLLLKARSSPPLLQLPFLKIFAKPALHSQHRPANNPANLLASHLTSVRSSDCPTR